MAEHSIISVDRSMLPPNKKQAEPSEIPIEGEEEQKAKPIELKGQVIAKKPTLWKRIRKMFIAEDVGDVKGWLVDEVFIPFLKDTALDLMALYFYGSVSGRRRSGKSRGGGDVYIRNDYSSKYVPQNSRGRDRGKSPRMKETNSDYRNVVLTDREDAKNVVEALYDRIDRYQNASIADLFEAVGLTSNYAQTRWGWTDKDQIGIKRVSDGYLIDVDEAGPLDE